MTTATAVKTKAMTTDKKKELTEKKPISVAVKKEDSGKEKAAKLAIDQIRDRFGDGAIMKFGENKDFEVESVSTGCLSLDLALGIGGVPRGRIVK